MITRLRIVAVAVLTVTSVAGGQRSPVPVAAATTRLTIRSTTLAEQRTVDVTVPHGYDGDSAKRYPVVVALDGEYEGEVAAAIARFYGNVGTLPGVIVVAVHNTARTRDLTPPSVPGFTPPSAAAGGADRFLTFLSDEVLPLVDKSYRTAPMRVLIGHSLGGLFALHAIAKKPDLFTGYVVMEPASWWNNGQPIEAATAALKRPEARRARVMLVNAPSLGADTTGWGGDRPMLREIRVAGESHEGMAAVGMAAGLRRLFDDFRPPEWRPGSSPIEMLNRYDSLTARIGYAVDVPASAYALVARMSLDSRFFADAETALARMEKAVGVTGESRELRDRLAAERNQPDPKFIPLVIPSRRPTPREASKFLGRWQSVDAKWPHTVDIRADGDTIIVHDRIDYPQGQPLESDDPVIQVTSAGVLEWGLPVFRGVAALQVYQARIIDDQTFEVTRQDRGFVRRGPADTEAAIRFKRVRR